MEDRLFGLDVQLLFDAFVLFVVIMIMYAIMSRLFFKPVRAFLEQRKQAVAADRDEAQQLQEAAEVSKAAYEEKLKAVHKEAEEILFLAVAVTDIKPLNAINTIRNVVIIAPALLGI